LSVSRLDRRKRLDVLIKAFAKLSTKMGNVVLIIVGTGPDEKRLKLLAEKLNCSNKILFTGFVNDDELWDYYYACDVFACPGWTTSPITAYEALAFQKKVVWSSEASEPDEILNDPHVFLADPDPESFAVALQHAINAKIETHIDLSKYTWDNYFKMVYDAIQLALN
jgi:glycosyltransferase involved in cell wall biosynthesis